jgi:hypothetical protein
MSITQYSHHEARPGLFTLKEYRKYLPNIISGLIAEEISSNAARVRKQQEEFTFFAHNGRRGEVIDRVKQPWCWGS